MSYRDGFLIQIIIYTLLWLYDDYMGLVISLIMAAILIGLLVFAFIIELIEKSKVPKSFFIWMLLSAFPPIIVSILFTLFSGGEFTWLDQF
ncbi:MAG: hypothetical protein ACO3M5_11335 [Saprospiraceae bacterium]|jgi:high-affinity Fe2+/Pb2+ permease